ncbi:E3 ubiquitin-protein ligase SINA-like 1 [Dioscorea cayenensis subsp. rotundata]|uniref:RING-type E3 ubiquitin transferase n=1 Tax=Dioscorea cayennensis subsp. rotundata TaxID=55577 RepID=A0AB40CYZ8_DIOCR|nr:E3 ubiquitin-protein ligase SINA-like 1 [Dioscorea cayenensis subsp. rotundata]
MARPSSTKRKEVAKTQEEKSKRPKDDEVSRGMLVRIEADAFDCPICFEALYPPIYQCPNGHLMCSKCTVKLTGKCPSCSQIIGLIRCLALEKIIETMEISCSNAGCDETLVYIDRASHQKSCSYAQCSCPVCSFQGCVTTLSQHFVDTHKFSAVKFKYESCFGIHVTGEGRRILISPDNRLFLLLINRDVTEGTALSVVGICPAAKEYQFTYELSVDMFSTHLELRAAGAMTCEWKGVHPKTYLFVPDDAFPLPKLQIFVTIKKNNVCPGPG